MAITRQKKEQLIEEYISDLKDNKWIIIFNQKWLEVWVFNDLRKKVKNEWWKIVLVRKRLFNRAVSSVDLSWNWEFDWSIVVLYFDWENLWNLKVINDIWKMLKKEKIWELNFIWWWFNWDWKDWNYVTELSSISSKEDLLWKFVYLLNYPIQSFAFVLSQIADNNWKWWDK